uniref:GTP cyclohydrolase N-terminal domain-containing protein n=1 Tax=Peronospora matthiolae TaxID=2874970 RepID=A0AAV1T3F6_9STRA
MVTIDPFGACFVEAFPEYIQKGYDIRPTIAVTRANMDFPEIHEAVRLGRLKPDGKILKNLSQLVNTEVAIHPVWYLPEVAKQFDTMEANFRQQIFQETNGMYSELVTTPSTSNQNCSYLCHHRLQQKLLDDLTQFVVERFDTAILDVC